jgi:hypothetical protein
MIEHQDYNTCKIAFGQRMSPLFTAEVLNIGKAFNWSRNRINYFVTCMALHSGYAFKNENTHFEKDRLAYGLIRFTELDAKKLGTNLNALRNMSTTEQLEYLYLHLIPHGYTIETLADMFMAFTLPEYACMPIDTVLHYTPDQPRYRDALPANLSGIITKREASAIATFWLARGLSSEHVGEFPA